MERTIKTTASNLKIKITTFCILWSPSQQGQTIEEKGEEYACLAMDGRHWYPRLFHAKSKLLNSLEQTQNATIALWNEVTICFSDCVVILSVDI